MCKKSVYIDFQSVHNYPNSHSCFSFLSLPLTIDILIRIVLFTGSGSTLSERTGTTEIPVTETTLTGVTVTSVSGGSSSMYCIYSHEICFKKEKDFDHL